MSYVRQTALALTWVAVAGCATAEGGYFGPTKEEVIAGDADLLTWCTRLGASPFCDICTEMGWYEDGECDSTLMAAGACYAADPDCGSPFCFFNHINEAIAINQWRRPLYAGLTDGESLAVSNALIYKEQLARPIAVMFDMSARPWQDHGIDLVCDELVSSDLTPEFESQAEVPSVPLSAFQKTDGDELSWRLRSALSRDGFEGLSTVVSEELVALAENPGYHCMVRHVLESILRCANLAPGHEVEAERLGLGSPLPVSRDMILAQISTLPGCSDIDEIAAPLHARGIPIVCQDVPPIPPGP